MIPPMSYRGVRRMHTSASVMTHWGPAAARSVLGLHALTNPRIRSYGQINYEFQDAYLVPFVLAAGVPRLARFRSAYTGYSLDEVARLLEIPSHPSGYPLWLKHILCVGLEVDLGELTPDGFEIEICCRYTPPGPIPTWIREHYAEHFG